MVFSSWAVSTLTTEMVESHQLLTRTLLWSGVMSTYFGTAPTLITWSHSMSSALNRYRREGPTPSAGEQSSKPSRPKFWPYIVYWET